MSAYSESYDVEESSFEEFDGSDELSLPFFKPGKKVSVPGTGLLSATLNTPKGPAKLNLPTAVPTQTQFRQLESALNAQTQRVNAVQAELVKVRRELVLRRRDQAGMGSSSMMSMLMPMLIQKKLKDHRHNATTGVVEFPAGSSDSLTTLLPLLMFAPNMFGGGSNQARTASAGGEQDAFSNPFMMIMLMEALA
jgi:hypothetical protein